MGKFVLVQNSRFYIAGMFLCTIPLTSRDLKAEEIENATVIIPRSMCASVLLNGILGFAMVIALLYCLGDLNAALSSSTGFPFIEVYTRATNSISGGTAMVSFSFPVSVFTNLLDGAMQWMV